MQRFDSPIYLFTQAELDAQSAHLAGLLAERDTALREVAEDEARFKAFAAEADDLKLHISRLVAELAACRAVVPPPPPPSGLPLIPFTLPPLSRNIGSWPAAAGSYMVRDGVLSVNVTQAKQGSPRVVRLDFGQLDPATNGFAREPKGVRRRYELDIEVPADYDARAGMCNLFQFHTDSPKLPPYLSFMLWSTTSRWRHIHPSGLSSDVNVNPIKLGHTYRTAIEAVWSTGPDGRLAVWEDGARVLDYRGPTYRSGEAPPYWLMGEYFPASDTAFSNTIRFSNLRAGTL